MALTLPLVMLPKRVLFVDDDRDFLEMIALAVPKWSGRMFATSPNDAIAALAGEPDHWAALEGVFLKAREARLDGSGEPSLFAKAYFNDWRRFRVTTVVVLDHSMPQMTGINFVEKLERTPAKRILLTGQAEPSVAIDAFNEGLIDKFIPKDFSIGQHLTNAVSQVHTSLCIQYGNLVRAGLTDEQHALLEAPAVVEALSAKIAALKWHEYVVLGQPFGLMGMGLQGPLQWLQLETSSSAVELAEAVSDYGYSGDDLKSIESGSVLTAAEMFVQLRLADPHVLAATEVLVRDPPLLGAVVDLPLPVLSASEYGCGDVLDAGDLVRSLARDAAYCFTQSSDSPQLHGPVSQLVSLAALGHSNAVNEALQHVPRPLAQLIATAVAASAAGRPPQ